MQERDNAGEQLVHVTRYIVVFILVWTAAVGGSLFFSVQSQRGSFNAELHSQAKAIHAMDMEYRSWAIGHGGVYVPVTESTPPSEFLAHVPERDITTPSGRKLTLLNSSYITRQVQELMRRHGAAVQSHIVSLKPINPVNRADAWETGALKRFEQGVQEVSGIEELHGEKLFRFMKPMITEKSCLKCHARQGYRVGDVRGGISVSIPLDEPLSALRGEERALMAGHGAVWLLGVAGLLFSGRRQRQAILSVEKSAAELKQSQKLLNSIVEHVPAMVFLKSADDLRFELFNRAGEQLLGYSREDLLGRNDHDLFPEEQADFFTRNDREVLESYRMAEIPEEMITTADGSEKWLRTSKVGLYDEDGRPTHLLGISMDITGSKLAEARIRKSQHDLAEAQRIAHLGSWRMDLATSEVTWSDELYELYGYDPAQSPPLYTDSMKLFTPDSWNRLSSAIAETAETGTPYELELEAVPETGERKWMLALGELERDAQGKGAGLRGVIMDITERKLAELELVKSQQELAEAQRVAQIGNWELDLVSNHLYWSDEIFEIFEVDKEKFGASYEAFLAAIHPEDRDMVNAAYTESVENHTRYEINHRLLMPDGRIKYVQERCQSFYDEAGKPSRSVGTVQDITHMHEVEEQLRQAQKMEAVGTLVGGIAHDFNNKLAAITGNLYLARQGVEEGSEVAERLEVVEKLSFEAASMVQQLLTFARKGKVEQTPLTLVSFIKEVAKLNRVAIPENIDLSVSYGTHPLPIMGDITQLQQIFLNLLTNARDALEGVENGRIEVALSDYEADDAFRTAHPEAEGVKGYACMQVRDNGHGISPEDLEHIFDPFFTTKAVGRGTGLGLAMVYGMVQAHHGIIEVESSPGEGTCFAIYLPLNGGIHPVVAEEEKEQVAEGKGETILLADDDESVLVTFSEVLRSIHYRVLTAGNGTEALKLYEKHADEIDLVILDIVMPGLKGPEVAKRIRAINPDTKLLYATGYDSQRGTSAEMRDADVLDKPYAIEQVSRTLRQILDS